jgi:hypothetical protein
MAKKAKFKVGDSILYVRNPDSHAAKYENGFPGYVLAVMEARIRVEISNSKGVKIVKDVSPDNLKRLEE